MDRHGIIVLGAGMAGLAAARRLTLLGHAPLLIAPEHAVQNRGETLSPKALPFLETLGWSHLLEPETALKGEDRFSVWDSPALRRSPATEGPGFHMDRARIEAEMLHSLSGVERITKSATQLEHLPKGIRVHLDDGHRIEASALIDCTGRNALSSGETAGRRRIDRLVAAWRVLDLPEETETLAATLVEAVAIGWWYASPMPGQRLMVGLFTDSDLLPPGASRDGKAWAGLLTEAEMTRARLDSFELTRTISHTPPLVAPAATAVNARLVEGFVLRAGDAAAALDPLAANGLATALWSGIASAQAALALIEGDVTPAEAYERDFLEGIAKQLSGQHALYAAERRFAHAPFWTRRQSVS